MPFSRQSCTQIDCHFQCNLRHGRRAAPTVVLIDTGNVFVLACAALLERQCMPGVLVAGYISNT